MSLPSPTAGAAFAREEPGAASAVRVVRSLEDRYRSLFLIGKGGMGSVEVALERGSGGFERIVALKRLLPEGARDPRHKEMFLREARLAALLAHPNVVHAFAFGELHGELFLAMEYVAGEPLSRVLSAARADGGAGRGIPSAIVAHVLAAACDGLHAAHELKDVGGQALNVVHRDLSPQNVMVAYEGYVKLLDFGVAKFDSAQSNTKTGEVKGKMAYMSPEQALGDPLDRRSDLFSLGAVLFECLSGERMWGTGTDLELMRKLALEEPRRLDAVMPEAPPALVDLQARLVARDRERRPATARAVADELRAFAQSKGVDARAVTALMHRLFATEAERQQAALTAALEDVAPAHVDALRKSLEPLHGQLEEVTLEQDSASIVPALPGASRRSALAWVVPLVATAIVVGIAAAGVVAVRTLGANGTAPATSTSSAAPPTTMAPSSTSTSTSTPTSAPPPPSTAPWASATGGGDVQPRAPAKGGARPIVTAAPVVTPPPTATATSKLPHVDPKPF